MAPTETELELNRLEAELRKLEAEYNMYFAGRMARPPWETRARVDQLVKQLDRSYMQNTGHKFRFHTLQSRFAAFIDLWDRALRAREEGRGGPFVPRKPSSQPPPAERKRVDDQVLKVASFKNPGEETEKLRELYNSLSEARSQLGEDTVPFQQFADLVSNQVSKLKATGSGEVAFRVAVKDGKVNLTARAMKSEDK